MHKQKPLRKAASDLAALNGTAGISWIIDVGGMHSTQDDLRRPSTPGSLAPVVARRSMEEAGLLRNHLGACASQCDSRSH